MACPYFKSIALGAMACLASQASAQYVTITTGTCSSQGYQYIDEQGECLSAAEEMNVVPTPIRTWGRARAPIYPRGCSYANAPSANRKSLTVNLDTNSTAICGTDGCLPPRFGPNQTCGCICKAGIAAETTSSTAQVTSTTIRLTTEFLAPTTFTTTKSSLPPSCIYTALADTAVKGWGTGGQKLKRASYESDADYLDACRAECNADSTCKGFVDDHTEGRPRMCKPKRSARWAYHKPEKTFYEKGLEC